MAVAMLGAGIALSCALTIILSLACFAEGANASDSMPTIRTFVSACCSAALIIVLSIAASNAWDMAKRPACSCAEASK